MSWRRCHHCADFEEFERHRKNGTRSAQPPASERLKVLEYLVGRVGSCLKTPTAESSGAQSSKGEARHGCKRRTCGQRFGEGSRGEKTAAVEESLGAVILHIIATPKFGAIVSPDTCADLAARQEADEGRVHTPFSGEGRPYGFYADPAHECRAFHVCNPQLTVGKAVSRIYSYYCPGDCVFDQLRSACMPPDASSPEACEQAERHYAVSEMFTLRTSVLASWATERPFSCEGITPGVYADLRSGCKSYFVCPVPTVFDQRTPSSLWAPSDAVWLYRSRHQAAPGGTPVGPRIDSSPLTGLHACFAIFVKINSPRTVHGLSCTASLHSRGRKPGRRLKLIVAARVTRYL
ncbi:hypothetical protein HPB50_024039 [Hyalomma asiaticum]|uniref:Uncharacterized protein n=1 Tax=Hyalomma asiaticum TaxID=266040 RepID=A0ACB7SZB1_HYAAI|nr:hypothetical protein HPB50_024039 [Hyalomma asiaticum]